MAQAGRIHVALLRGINVGGKNKLPMDALRSLFAEVGCAGVLTYIQSGNVVYRANAALARRVSTVLPRAIEKRFGLRVPVVTRTAAQLRKVAAGNPFLERGAEFKHLQVMFLAERPAAARVAKLDPDRSPPDEFAVRGSEIYFHTPNGVARSKFTSAYIDSTLETICTGRNWNTVLKLLDLVERA